MRAADEPIFRADEKDADVEGGDTPQSPRESRIRGRLSEPIASTTMSIGIYELTEQVKSGSAGGDGARSLAGCLATAITAAALVLAALACRLRWGSLRSWQFGQTEVPGGGEVIVAAAKGGASLGVASFRVRHFGSLLSIIAGARGESLRSENARSSRFPYGW